MNDQEFDNKIRENALAQESRTEKPQWNKKGTWNRIESGLEKKNRAGWWKAAAIIILFLSAGWSYAQWSNYKRFEQEKEMQISRLQQQVNELSSVQRAKELDCQNIIQKKNNAIDSLKIQLLVFRENNHKRILLKPKSESRVFTENIKKSAENMSLIDSLKNTIAQLQLTALKKDQSVFQKQKQVPDQSVKKEVKEIAPERQILYIGNHFQPETTKKKKGLKIGIFGSQENSEMEYKSDHSIFNK